MSQPVAKFAVALASHEVAPIRFAYDLGNLCALTTAKLPNNIEFGITMVAGTYVHAAREKLLRGAIKDGATHILWLDTDMRFPPDALIKLLNRQVPVVGINYVKRSVPTTCVAIKEFGGKQCETREDSTGIEEVHAIGFGCVLMRVEYLKGLPADKDWFWFERLPDGRLVGEDVYFCRLLRETCGVPIFVDHDLSKECAHIGQFEYELLHADNYFKKPEPTLIVPAR